MHLYPNVIMYLTMVKYSSLHSNTVDVCNIVSVNSINLKIGCYRPALVIFDTDTDTEISLF